MRHLLIRGRRKRIADGRYMASEGSRGSGISLLVGYHTDKMLQRHTVPVTILLGGSS